MLTLKDERFRVMISGMRILKLYGWELGFEDIINQIRVKEIQMIRRTQAAMVALIVEFKLAPFLMSVAAFYCYVLINPTHISTARTAFVGISVISDLGMAFGKFSLELERGFLRRLNTLEPILLEPHRLKLQEVRLHIDSRVANCQ